MYTLFTMIIETQMKELTELYCADSDHGWMCVHNIVDT